MGKVVFLMIIYEGGNFYSSDRPAHKVGDILKSMPPERDRETDTREIMAPDPKLTPWQVIKMLVWYYVKRLLIFLHLRRPNFSRVVMPAFKRDTFKLSELDIRSILSSNSLKEPLNDEKD